jgi:hypothetical protein
MSEYKLTQKSIISFFILLIFVGIIIGLLIDHFATERHNKKYKSYMSYSSSNFYDPAGSAAETLYSIDNCKYSKSSYEYYIKRIKKYCVNSEASIADIVYITQENIYKFHNVKPTMFEIIRGLSIAVENDHGQIYDLKEIAAAFAVIY